MVIAEGQRGISTVRFVLSFRSHQRLCGLMIHADDQQTHRSTRIHYHLLLARQNAESLVLLFLSLKTILISLMRRREYGREREKWRECSHQLSYKVIGHCTSGIL